MDKVAEKAAVPAQRWDWLPALMPGVAGLMKAARQRDGDAHVRECWKRGVLQREPGWYFAREGAIAVGVPWAEIADLAGWQVTRTQAVLLLRPKERAHGA
jgi:hypothetical protein